MDATDELMIGRGAACRRVCNQIEVNGGNSEDRPRSSSSDRDGPEANIAVVTITEDGEETNADVITITDDEDVEYIACDIDNKQGSEINSSSHKCEKCQAVFASARGLSIHIREHLGLKPYKCPSCKQAFTTVAGLRIHAKVHRGVELQLNFICKICGETFPSTYLLERHRKRKHRDELFAEVCELCTKGFLSISELHAHEKIHLKKKLLEQAKPKPKPIEQFTVCFIETVHACKLCKREYLTEAELNEHMHIHTTQWQHRCKPCDRNFGNSVELNMHNLQFHTGHEVVIDKPITCVPCAKSFANEAGLHDHKLLVHRAYTCRVCRKFFANHEELANHIDKNTRNRGRRKCSICTQEFRTHCDLSEHLRPDGIQAPIPCKQCNDAFAYPCALEMHCLTHEPDTLQEADQSADEAGMGGDELLAFPVSDADNQSEASKVLVNTKGNQIKDIGSFQKFIKKEAGEEINLAEDETAPTKNLKSNIHEAQNPESVEIKLENSEDCEEFEFIDTRKKIFK